MNLIRRLLYILLGKSLYFRTVSMIFLMLYKAGLLSVFKKFQTHYLVKKLIHKDDIIIDIGANFGYFTSIFARQTGPKGTVYAVEPVKLYMDILKNNTRRFSNIELVPYALSDSEGETVMGIESEQKYRHGLTKIMAEENTSQSENGYTVLRKTPESVFGQLNKLDYIKCDIEGHEIKVIPGFKELIEKFNPVIQIELEKANFDTINLFLTNSGYTPYIVLNNRLAELVKGMNITSDIIYIHKIRSYKFNDILKP